MRFLIPVIVLIALSLWVHYQNRNADRTRSTMSRDWNRNEIRRYVKAARRWARLVQMRRG